VLDEDLSMCDFNAMHDWEGEIISPPEEDVQNDEASEASEDEYWKQPGLKPHKLWPSYDDGAPNTKTLSVFVTNFAVRSRTSVARDCNRNVSLNFFASFIYI
jgi:hypothetical protein